MTICELHSLAFACGVPSRMLHDVLHDAAYAAFGVASMSLMTPGQCAELGEIFRTWAAKRRQAAPRRSGVYSNYSARPRSGRRTEPGVIKAISPAQQELIFKIANQLRWTREIFGRWLQAEFGIDSPDRILTSSLACKVIQGLIRADKRSKYPSAPARRGSSPPWGHRADQMNKDVQDRQDGRGAVRAQSAVTLPPRESANEFFGKTRRSSHVAAQATP